MRALSNCPASIPLRRGDEELTILSVERSVSTQQAAGHQDSTGHCFLVHSAHFHRHLDPSGGVVYYFS